jgi:hypothetical protein
MWEPTVLHWPDERARRERLRQIGLPCLLLLAVEADLPGDLDVAEDWVQLPAPDEDIATRARVLGRRVRDAVRLEDTVLRTVHGSTTLSPREAAVVAVLLERRDAPTPVDVLVAAAGTPLGERRRLHDVVHRVRLKVRPHGLDVHGVRRQGYRLGLRIDDQPDPDTDQAPGPVRGRLIGGSGSGS